MKNTKEINASSNTLKHKTLPIITITFKIRITNLVNSKIESRILQIIGRNTHRKRKAIKLGKPQEWEEITQQQINASKGIGAEELTKAINMIELTNTIQNLENTASGPDRNSNEVYKALFRKHGNDNTEKDYEIVRNAILKMLNHLLEGYKLPNAWHDALITCIFKPGETDRENPASYRPIALLNNLYKIFSAILTFAFHTRATTRPRLGSGGRGDRRRQAAHVPARFWRARGGETDVGE
jgi:hypothetical protein